MSECTLLQVNVECAVHIVKRLVNVHVSCNVCMRGGWTSNKKHTKIKYTDPVSVPLECNVMPSPMLRK